MKKILILAAVTVGITLYYFGNNRQWLPPVFTTYGSTAINNTLSDSGTAARHYQKFCSGCHGVELEKFTGHQWKNGKTKSAIFKAIKYGYANDGMPGYDTTFSDKEIYSLSDYILNFVPQQKQEKPKQQSGIYTTNLLTVKADTVATNVGVPWCVAFLPGNQLLVTDRNGRLLQIDAVTKKMAEIKDVPKTVAKGQGGFFDVLPHPNFASNQLLYLAYSKPENGQTGGKSTTAIMLAQLDKNRLVNTRDIFVALPYSSTHHHYGGRMAIGQDSCLYFSVGERGNEKENPQNPGNHLGKIHRIRLDGSVPTDNPFVNDNKAAATIWSLGNRNPQGLLSHPTTGHIWANEHGPMGGDEINWIQKGHNYGWPVITYGVNYNGTSITDKTAMPGMDQPVHFWVPSIAVSGMAIVTGSRYPQWEGNLLCGSLKFNWVSRCTMEGTTITAEESMLKGIGRLRDIRQSPDGFIYITVENPGMLLRLLPQQ
jgi:aldose sugar dehydrogenase